MDRKLIIGGIVAAVLVLGGVGYAAYKGATPPPPPPSQIVPTEQLQNELPSDTIQQRGTYAPTGERAPQ